MSHELAIFFAFLGTFLLVAASSLAVFLLWRSQMAMLELMRDNQQKDGEHVSLAMRLLSSRGYADYALGTVTETHNHPRPPKPDDDGEKENLEEKLERAAASPHSVLTD